MTSKAPRVASLIKNRRRLYLALFALTARMWIDEVTSAVHELRDLADRVDKLEAEREPVESIGFLGHDDPASTGG